MNQQVKEKHRNFDTFIFTNIWDEREPNANVTKLRHRYLFPSFRRNHAKIQLVGVYGLQSALYSQVQTVGVP